MFDEAGQYASFGKAISPPRPTHSYDSPVYPLKIECSLSMGDPSPYRKLLERLSEGTADTRGRGDTVNAEHLTHAARTNLRSNISSRHVQGAVGRDENYLTYVTAAVDEVSSPEGSHCANCRSPGRRAARASRESLGCVVG
jgi:hypothetical protein